MALRDLMIAIFVAKLEEALVFSQATVANCRLKRNRVGEDKGEQEDERYD